MGLIGQIYLKRSELAALVNPAAWPRMPMTSKRRVAAAILRARGDARAWLVETANPNANDFVVLDD